MGYPYGQDIEVRPRALVPGRDPETGNEVWDYPVEDRWTLGGVALAPRYATEVVQAGLSQQVMIGWTVYSDDPEVDVRENDRFWHDGREWDIQGSIARWVSPFTGWGAGSVIELIGLTDGV